MEVCLCTRTHLQVRLPHNPTVLTCFFLQHVAFKLTVLNEGGFTLSSPFHLVLPYCLYVTVTSRPLVLMQ